MAAAAWQRPDGTLWQMGEPRIVGEGGQLTTRILTSEHSGGYTYLTVQLSRAPFTVEAVLPSDLYIATTGNGDDITLKAVAIVRREGEVFPDVPGAIKPDGVASLFSIGGRLIPLHHDSPWFYLTSALRAAGVKEDHPPLYAFGHDGVHLLKQDTGTPAGHYVDTQLLTRHVALGAGACAPLPDGTAFVTEAGIMKLKGNTVSVLEKGGRGMEKEYRLVYVYSEDRVIGYSPGEGDISEHHYAWPELWVRSRDTIGRVIGTAAAPTAPAPRIVEGEPAMVPVKTRPIKLGDPFAAKQLREVEAIWPDGSAAPVKVYGAMRLGKWYFLGLAPRGKMTMRGSGWRFFRVETFATPHLPTIRFFY